MMDLLLPDGSTDIALALQAADEMQGLPQPDVESHQQHYVRYRSWQEARLSSEWSAKESHAAASRRNQSPSEVPMQLERVSMKIVRAPAAFARPLVQRKLFRPPFKVQLMLTYRGPLDVVLHLEAVTMVDTHFARPATWRHEAGAGQQQQDLENGTHHRQVMLPNPGDDEERTHREEFEFADLRFIKSSRMSKRRLAFVLQVQGDVLFVVYTLPTVVISRRTDQYGKAYETLMGAPPAPPKRPASRAATLSGLLTTSSVPTLMADAAALHIPGLGGAPGWARLLAQSREQQHEHQEEQQQQQQAQQQSQQQQRQQLQAETSVPVEAELLAQLTEAMRDEDEPQPASIDASYAASWIAQHYAAAGFQRQLTSADFAALLRAAGINARDDRGETAGADDAWAGFRDWFIRTLRLLKDIRSHWERAQPSAVCGFATDRGAAETALSGHRTGTFLVRLCEEAGTLVVSACDVEGDGTRAVDHVLLDCEGLRSKSLVAWLAAMPHAAMLLDLDTGQTYRKEAVFSPDSAANTAALAGDSGTQELNAASLPPLYSAGGSFEPGGDTRASADHAGSTPRNLFEQPRDGASPQHHSRNLLRRASASAPAQVWAGAEGAEDDSMDLYNLGSSASLHARLPAELAAALPAAFRSSLSTPIDSGHPFPDLVNRFGGESGL